MYVSNSWHASFPLLIHQSCLVAFSFQPNKIRSLKRPNYGSYRRWRAPKDKGAAQGHVGYIQETAEDRKLHTMDVARFQHQSHGVTIIAKFVLKSLL